MRVIFASETPVIVQELTYRLGGPKDGAQLSGQWLVRTQPKLEIEEGDQPSDWAIVSKVLTGVSWITKMEFGVRMKSQENPTELEAWMYLPNFRGSSCRLKRLLHLFGKTVFDTDTTHLLKIKLGTSNCIQFDGYYYDFKDDDSERLQEGKNCYKQLTENEALRLLMMHSKNVAITWEESFKALSADAISTCKRIIDTGDFADCFLVSNQAEESPCHQVILKEHCPKFGMEFANGKTKIVVDLCTSGVGALLLFMYCGELNNANNNWKLSLELFKFAHSTEVRNLSDAIVRVLMEMKEEPEMKTLAEVFQILVNSGKLAAYKDLARKLFGILAKKSTEDVADSQILHKYMRHGVFFNAWMDLTSEALQTQSGPPIKRAKLTKQ